MKTIIIIVLKHDDQMNKMCRVKLTPMLKKKV